MGWLSLWRVPQLLPSHPSAPQITKLPPKDAWVDSCPSSLLPPAHPPQAAYGQWPGAPGGKRQGGPGAAWHSCSCRDMSCEGYAPLHLCGQVVWPYTVELSWVMPGRRRGCTALIQGAEGALGGPAQREGGWAGAESPPEWESGHRGLAWFQLLAGCTTLGGFWPTPGLRFSVWGRMGVSSSPQCAERGAHEQIWS